MRANQFKCAMCKGIFNKGLTEEQKLEQLKEEFGEGWTPEDCETVCDDCYKKMFGVK